MKHRIQLPFAPPFAQANWENLFNTAKADVIRLSSEIAAAEREIDRLVYEAFALTADEIALLETSLEGQV
jgi:hypothetical protein